MFRRFYNMSYNPFTKSVKSRDEFNTKDLQEIHARLDHLSKSGGIGLITAEPGVGKTFALRAWCNKLNKNTSKYVYICLSTVTNREFFKELSLGLGVEPKYHKYCLFEDIQNCIKVYADERKMKVILIIDEAQYLPSSVLKDLQIITNFDMDSRDLLSIVLVGHTVLSQILTRQPYESLRQRLKVNYRMSGISEDEVKNYVQTQLAKVNADNQIFDNAALSNLYSLSGGSIRKLNSIITNALTIGAQEEKRSIDIEIVQAAANELVI